ncbi:uncharacterized protein LOC126995604 isoform X2 [Eriocheir sinensis]|uniref:uncharacterized protein LOC126995604 isoform X2 n=1 Tax=Eriocheir sinensis TaxID=95602 RepID=UPI0021C7E469|nr:uncharacterized protein LOC126995604 isoform X2 [Eriocheir sinensis]
MASLMDQFTLESVKDFMVSRGGRVTNHQLVNQFKPFLTNPAGKEIARNKFKQYVNTLANISNEGGEKYLVLKRKYRVGTPLDENYVSPVQSPTTPAFATPPQYNIYGSPRHGSPFSPTIPAPTPPAPPLPSRATPPYRAPPPYRPPPPATPTHQGYMAPDDMTRRYDPSPQQFNGRSDPRYQGDVPRYPPVSEPRFNEARFPYDEPADLGIPPPPQTIRSASSMSSLSSGHSFGGSSAPQSPGAPYGGYGNAPPLTPLSASRPRSLSLHQMSSTSEDGDSLSVSATTMSSASTPSSEEPPPPVPPRRRQVDNKENMRPAPDGEEGAKMVAAGDGSSEDGSVAGNGEERKVSVSVREQTQKFNKLASESQLPNASSRGSSKSNRSSRSDRDDDDSTSILSYGPEGQEWQVAAAKSDFNEILRLLKTHPSLARHKVRDHSVVPADGPLLPSFTCPRW